MKTNAFSSFAALSAVTNGLDIGNYTVLNVGNYFWNGTVLLPTIPSFTNNGIALSTAYTVTGTDIGNFIPCNGLFNVSIPIDSTAGFKAGNGATLCLNQQGTAANNFITVTGSGVVIDGAPPPPAQNVFVTLVWKSTNRWVYL